MLSDTKENFLLKIIQHCLIIHRSYFAKSCEIKHDTSLAIMFVTEGSRSSTKHRVYYIS